MQTLDILVVLDIQVPVDDDGTLARRRCGQVLVPLLDRLDEHPSLRCTLHLSGRLLPWLAQQRPDDLARLQAFVRDGRVELLGGGFYDPILAAIPDHDATGQLGLTASVLKKHSGGAPRGVWLTGRAWAPCLTAMLNRAGYRYTLIDQAHAVACGLPADGLDGCYITERTGFALTLFPIHSAFQRRLLEASRARREQLFRDAVAGRERRGVVLAWDDMDVGGDLGSLLRLTDDFQREGHWIKTHTLGDFVERNRPTTRCYPPAVLEGDDPAGSGAGIGWERFLVDYPEVNELHKRMLMASYRVQRMRSAAPGGGADARRQLQLACSLLWEAQHHGLYTHGAQPGFYDGARRDRGIARLIRVENMATAMLGESDAGASQREVDFDCDGHPELSLRTGSFRAAIAPARGGGLLTLDLVEHEIGLQSVIRRHPEPYHVTSGSSDIQLVDADEPSVDVPLAVDASPDLDDKLWFDDTPRMSFLDHFLGEGTTLNNWYRNCYREVGDFVGGRYEIVADAEAGDPDELSVLLGRSGGIREGDHQSLLRVEKRYAFHRTLPRLRVEYRLANRYYEPIRAHFGVEIDLWLPGIASDQLAFRAIRGEGDEYNGHPDAPAALEQVSYLELLDSSRSLIAGIYLDDPLDVWVMPIETVNRVGDDLRRFPQGIGLLFHRPADLWGTEEVRASFKLEFMRS